MSNFIKAVKARKTTEFAHLPVKSKLFNHIFSKDESYSDAAGIFPDRATVYDIQVTLGNRAYIPEYSNGTELTEAIHRTKRSIIEAVFGEFREDFRLIEMYLYQQEFEKARQALLAMEHKMYSTED